MSWNFLDFMSIFFLVNNFIGKRKFWNHKITKSIFSKKKENANAVKNTNAITNAKALIWASLFLHKTKFCDCFILTRKS